MESGPRAPSRKITPFAVLTTREPTAILREECSHSFSCYLLSVTANLIDVAKDLAAAHREEDPETKLVFLAKSNDEIRLVEVSGSIGDSGEVLPFRFAPREDLGVPFASVVILLSENDWKRLENGELELPAGWGDTRSLQKIA